MSKLRNVKTGQVIEAVGPDAIAAVQSGEWQALEGVDVQSDHGPAFKVDPDQLDVASSLDPELSYQDPEQLRALEAEANLQRDFGGTGQQVLTGLEGVASGLTAGGSDWIASKLEFDTAKRAEANPGTRAVGQGVGMLAGGLAGAGVGATTAIGKALALTPAGGLAKLGAGAATKLGGGVAAQAAGQALEGTLLSAGIASGEAVIKDPEISAEALLEQIGPVALLGGAASGVVGGAVAGIGKAASAYRKSLDVSPLVNMNSASGRKLSQHIADSHGKLDAIGAGVAARYGSRAQNKAALSEMVASDVEQVHKMVNTAKTRADNLFAEAEKKTMYEADSVLEPQVIGTKVEAEKIIVPQDVNIYRRALAEEHNAIEDMLLSTGQEKQFAADIRAIRKAKAEVDGLKRKGPLGENDPALAAMQRYEGVLTDVGRKLNRDTKGSLKTLMGGEVDPRFAGMKPVGTVSEWAPVPQTKPVTDALAAARASRKALDDLGALDISKAKNAKLYSDTLERFGADADNLQKALGGRGGMFTPDVTMLKQHLGKLAGQFDNASAEAALASESARGLNALRKSANKAFGADDRITSADINRMLRKSPEEFMPALQKLDDYYKGIKAAAKDSGDMRALSNLEDTMSAYSSELAEQAGLAATDFTPEMLAAALGIASTAIPNFEGPTDEMLKAAVVISMLTKGGRRGVAQGRSFVGKLARAMFVRGGAGLAAQQAGGLMGRAGVQGGARAMGQGAAAAAGFQAFGGIFDNLQGIAHATGAAQSTIKSTAEAIATGAKRANRVVPTFGALAAKLSMDGKEESDERKAFEKVADTLARYAVNPEQANAAMYEKLKPLQATSPHLADELEVKAGMVLQYLYDWMPKDPGTMMLLGKSMWQPTGRELYEFHARMLGALAPQEAIQGIADGVIPPQAADALRETNPAMFAKFQNDIMEYADKLREGDYPTLVSLGIAFDVPLHPTTDGRYVAWIQGTRQTHAGEQQAAMSNPPSGSVQDPTADETYTAAQKMMEG